MDTRTKRSVRLQAERDLADAVRGLVLTTRGTIVLDWLVFAADADTITAIAEIILAARGDRDRRK